MPHFMDVAPEYQTVSGMKPDAEKHQIFVDFEPVTFFFIFFFFASELRQ